MTFENFMLCVVVLIAIGFILLVIMSLMKMATWADENLRMKDKKNGDDD